MVHSQTKTWYALDADIAEPKPEFLLPGLGSYCLTKGGTPKGLLVEPVHSIEVRPVHGHHVGLFKTPCGVYYRTILPKIAVPMLNWTWGSQTTSANDQHWLLVPVAHHVEVLHWTLTGPRQLRLAGQGLDLTLFLASFGQLFFRIDTVPIIDA